MSDMIKKALIALACFMLLSPIIVQAQQRVLPPIPPAEAPIAENVFQLDRSSGLWVRPFSVSGDFSKNLVDPNFVLKNYEKLGIDEARRLRLIDLVANASADMTRTEHLTDGVNDKLNEQLAEMPIKPNVVMKTFDEVLDRENSLKRIRFQLMIDATSLLEPAEIKAYHEMRASKSKAFFRRLELKEVE